MVVCPKAIFVDCATKINIINPNDTRRKVKIFVKFQAVIFWPIVLNEVFPVYGIFFSCINKVPSELLWAVDSCETYFGCPFLALQKAFALLYHTVSISRFSFRKVTIRFSPYI